VARMTLKTVADKVGVSAMTVSNAFSRPDQLSAELRDRILAAAEELGYVGPDPAARALARGTTGAVGIVLTSMTGTAFADEMATKFLRAIIEGLAPTGLSLTLLSGEEAAGRVPARDVPMDGALVFDCDPASPALGWLRRRKLPVVFVDQDPAPGVPCINVDDRGGARAAAEHVIGLGHRRIGIVNAGVVGPHGLQTSAPAGHQSIVTEERMLGWMDALNAADVSPTIVKQRDHTEEDGSRALHLLLAADPGITAVLCFSDTLAHGVMLAAQDKGMELPRDLSVVGFDDNPLAARLRPALTTVWQDGEEKGRLAAEMLVRLLAATQGGRMAGATGGDDKGGGDKGGGDKGGGDKGGGDKGGDAPHIVLPTKLVVRDSTAPPANVAADGR
jgi:DNA-binding LacI/PurR family transcriptional regulator